MNIIFAGTDKIWTPQIATEMQRRNRSIKLDAPPALPSGYDLAKLDWVVDSQKLDALNRDFLAVAAVGAGIPRFLQLSRSTGLQQQQTTRTCKTTTTCQT